MSPELVPFCCGFLLPPPTQYSTSLGCTHQRVLYMLSSCNRKFICEVNRCLLCFFSSGHCTWSKSRPALCPTGSQETRRSLRLHLANIKHCIKPSMSRKINQWCLRIEFCSILIKSSKQVGLDFIVNHVHAVILWPDSWITALLSEGEGVRRPLRPRNHTVAQHNSWAASLSCVVDSIQIICSHTHASPVWKHSEQSLLLLSGGVIEPRCNSTSGAVYERL